MSVSSLGGSLAKSHFISIPVGAVELLPYVACLWRVSHISHMPGFLLLFLLPWKRRWRRFSHMHTLGKVIKRWTVGRRSVISYNLRKPSLVYAPLWILRGTYKPLKSCLGSRGDSSDLFSPVQVPLLSQLPDVPSICCCFDSGMSPTIECTCVQLLFWLADNVFLKNAIERMELAIVNSVYLNKR